MSRLRQNLTSAGTPMFESNSLFTFQRRCKPSLLSSPTIPASPSALTGTRFSRVKSPPKGYRSGTSSLSSSATSPSSFSHSVYPVLPALPPSEFLAYVEDCRQLISKHLRYLRKELIVLPLSQKDRKSLVKSALKQCTQLSSHLDTISSFIKIETNLLSIERYIPHLLKTSPNSSTSDHISRLATMIEKDEEFEAPLSSSSDDVTLLSDVEEGVAVELAEAGVESDSVDSSDLENYFASITT
ncbi:hypothetical protein GEMRC1_012179 [Eukaryota sp. GEM-RC1]